MFATPMDGPERRECNAVRPRRRRTLKKAVRHMADSVSRPPRDRRHFAQSQQPPPCFPALNELRQRLSKPQTSACHARQITHSSARSGGRPDARGVVPLPAIFQAGTGCSQANAPRASSEGSVR